MQIFQIFVQAFLVSVTFFLHWIDSSPWKCWFFLNHSLYSWKWKSAVIHPSMCHFCSSPVLLQVHTPQDICLFSLSSCGKVCWLTQNTYKIVYLFNNYILTEPHIAHMITAQVLSIWTIIQGTPFNFIGFIDTATVCDFSHSCFCSLKIILPMSLTVALSIL